MSDWLVLPEPKPAAEFVVVIFHHAGGGAQNYVKMAVAAPTNCEVVLVELPGRGFHPAASNPMLFDAVCQRVANEVRIHAQKRKIIIFGHSMGGILGFEVARLLAEHCAIESITVSATGPRPIQWAFNENSPKAAALMSTLPLNVQKNPAALEIFKKRFLFDLQLLAGADVQPLVKSDVRLRILGGKSDPLVPVAALDEWTHYSKNVEIITFPGGHFYFENDVNIGLLLGVQNLEHNEDAREAD